MAIVRELLIRLGFQTDKKAINATNQAITGFKTRFAIAATAATYAFSKITQFFGDIATATLDSAELAKTLGVSLKELTAIQAAAQQVGRLDFKQTSQAFSGLNKMLNNFRTGADQTLQEIARGLKFEVDREGGPQKLFDQILTGLSQIATEQERIRISSNIFGDELGPKIAALATNIDAFKESTKNFADVGAEAEKQLPAFRAYEQSVNALTQSWTKFTLAISQTVFPVLQKLIEYLTIMSDFARSVFTLDGSGVKSSLNAASSLLDPLFEKTGLNNISDFFKKNVFGGQSALNGLDGSFLQRLKDYAENKPGYQYQGFLNPAMAGGAPNITNNIDISVPPGTTAEQAEYMSTQIKNAVRESVDDTFREIQYNNPQVE